MVDESGRSLAASLGRRREDMASSSSVSGGRRTAPHRRLLQPTEVRALLHKLARGAVLPMLPHNCFPPRGTRTQLPVLCAVALLASGSSRLVLRGPEAHRRPRCEATMPAPSIPHSPC